MKDVITHLREQHVSETLIEDVLKFRGQYTVDPTLSNRLGAPQIYFYGKDILEMSIAALLQGENLLLSGAKATGKNILCETLACVFNRPQYNVSFHVNTDSSTLIGTDTFVNNEVSLRKGIVYLCAEHGGFGILDEINMAKNDAVSVLHSTLDYRRVIDVPGYDKIELHPATRFIGTMNYGYAGTKELNEALVSRFMVVDMPPLNEESLTFLLSQYYPTITKEALKQFSGLFIDLQDKAYNGEISTKPIDLRGMISAIGLMGSALSPLSALRLGIINKSFDPFEKEIIEDTVMTRIPADWDAGHIFNA